MSTCYNRLAEAVLTSTQNLCFEQKFENKAVFFLSENFHIGVVKYSVYLNSVFRMLNSNVLSHPALSLQYVTYVTNIIHATVIFFY